VASGKESKGSRQTQEDSSSQSEIVKEKLKRKFEEIALGRGKDKAVAYDSTTSMYSDQKYNYRYVKRCQLHSFTAFMSLLLRRRTYAVVSTFPPYTFMKNFDDTVSFAGSTVQGN
jgi:hypothetical protein